MLTDYPVRFDAAEVRQTLAVLESIYREAEIVAVIQDAGLPIGQIAFQAQPYLTWQAVESGIGPRSRSRHESRGCGNTR